MNKSIKKNEDKKSAQLDLFKSEENVALVSKDNPHNVNSKIISLPDYKHQQEIKKFYEIANEMTSHLK